MAVLKRAVSISILLCWLWALALAASPELHEWLHGQDAGHEDHECVAKLIAAGGCDAPAVAAVVVAAPVAWVETAWQVRNADVPDLFLMGGPMEHGPPVAGV